MHLDLGECPINNSGIVLRTASTKDIDILSEIDIDAATLFARAGLRPDFPSDHVFAVTERDRWLRCLAAGTVLVAVDSSGWDVGFAAVDSLDGEPYLVQLSVRLSAMRRGVGGKLLSAAASTRIKGHALWLITYNHLTWNRPFYERNGFMIVPDDRCGGEIRRELFYQRRWLPMPEERIVMRRDIMHGGTQ